ncbi:hypothetical protein J7E79_07090 [Bacillus sp. ISL-40]|uniref:hypothetical protein n=1 Tax=Bacillus sp. ISL-40 TaxID=2819126 RepID=UPI001BEBD62E|nr:hypothetical protein [Bacillus sp. ISL-40]MBT2697174.1 hypothetical protein [Bacillus sp. ISL-40]
MKIQLPKILGGFFLLKMKCRSESMDKNKRKTPNVSGSFQVIEDDRKKTIEELRKDNKLDEETEYYARIFMED